jgi:hypothetical protein
MFICPICCSADPVMYCRIRVSQSRKLRHTILELREERAVSLVAFGSTFLE